jgi:1,2-diacylglycerol 3-beta-galactosyltransferase
LSRKVLLLITDSGGGHRGTANSLKESARLRGLGWDLEIVNVYRDVWGTRPAGRWSGKAGEDLYNFILRHGLTGLAAFLRKTARLSVRLNQEWAFQDARRYFLRERPALVVSLMPFVNDVFARALKGTGIPFGLIATDLVDTRPFMWFTPLACRQAAFVAAGCDEAAEQARSQGTFQVLDSGLIIHPKHFDPASKSLTQPEARKRLGLEPALFTVLAVMGGMGGSVLEDFARQFESSRERWQVVVCCGRNEGLKQSLERLAPKLKNRLVPVGFTSELHVWMRASDVCLTKPGPASIMEAAAMGTPLVLDDSKTMPQEAPNAALVEREGWGLACRHRRHMLAAVQSLCANPSRLSRIRKRLEKASIEDASGQVLEAMAEAMELPQTASVPGGLLPAAL